VLDTIINIASFKVIRKITEARLRRPIFINYLNAQGDDVILSTSDTITAEYIMDTYEKLGYEVHRLKTFISRNRAEFLRQL